MKEIIFINDGVFHPSYRARRTLGRLLYGLENISVRQIRSFEQLPELELESIHALVIYVHHKTISDRALSVFDRYVKGGGGVLGIHTATASFKRCPHYFEILGGRFIRHHPIAPFAVLPVEGSNEPFDGVPGFSVRDEMYLHELQPGIQVHFEAQYEDERVPMVWTYSYGAGKVCYAVPGHLAGAFQHEPYQQIIKRGLAWVST